MPFRSSRFSIAPRQPVPGAPATIVFDATTSRARQRSGQAISHAKETGDDQLTDDLLLEPVVLQITAHFVDFPMYALGFEGRSAGLVAQVRAVHSAKARCVVIAGDDIYTSMVIESVGEPYDSDTGDGVDIEFTLKEVDTGDLTLVDAVVDAQTQALGALDAIDIGWLP